MNVLKDITVLIAEDERSVRMLLRVVLEAAGARVIEADNGATAARLLDLHPDVDVLVTDVNMPTLDGAALARHARRLRPSTPIVACSALDLQESRPEMLLHVNAVVRKPFVPSELIRTIALALAQDDDATLAAS